MTPTTAARSRIQKFSNIAKAAPEIAMSAEPPKSTARRPTRSAMRVRSKERATSPSKVRVMNKPICESENLRALKKSAIIIAFVP